MRAAAPLHEIHVDEWQIGFVDERRGLQHEVRHSVPAPQRELLPAACRFDVIA
jgi:hypothetical protein